MKNYVQEYAALDPWVAKALQIATDAHKDQTRRDGSPYISHPIAVANILGEKYGGGPLALEYIVCGLLHDVVEDTDWTLEDLANEGYRLYALDALTRRKEESYAKFIERIAKADVFACRIKLADLEHNLSDLKEGPRRDKYELAKLHLEYSVLIYMNEACCKKMDITY